MHFSEKIDHEGEKNLQFKFCQKTQKKTPDTKKRKERSGRIFKK